jgi:hypothetical protein
MVATLYVNAALLLQQPSSWDLRSMWGTMSLLAKVFPSILSA